MERPQLTRLREAIRRREVDVVVCYAIDRLARDPVHLGVILTEADHAKVEVEFVSEPLDNSPEGQLIRFVRGYAAKVEHEKIRERSIRGKRARVESGRLLPGPRPLYGYRWRDETRTALVIDETTAPVVRRMFRDTVSGIATRKLCLALMDDNIPTPMGKSNVWNTSTLRQILLHPAYAGQALGWRSLHANAWRIDYNRAIELPEGTIPPIVDRETWEAAQAQLRRNKQLATRNNKKPTQALLRGGYVRCGYCDSTMITVNNNSGKHQPVYRCSRSGAGPRGCGTHAITTHLLDDAVWAKIEAILTQPAIIAAEVAKQRTDDPTATDLTAIDRDHAKIERQQANLTRAIAMLDSDDPDAAAPLVAELSSLRRRRQQLETERANVLQRREAWTMAQARLDSIQDWCRSVGAKLRTLTYDEKRLALEALGVRATIYRQDHEPRYVIEANIPLSSPIVGNTPR